MRGFKPFLLFRGRVSRRILATVTLCALLPTLALIGLTLSSTQQRLESDTARRLHNTGKNIGMALMAELSSIENELRQLASVQSRSQFSGAIETIPTPFEQNALSAIWLFRSIDQLENFQFQPQGEIRSRLNSNKSHLSLLATATENIALLWVPVLDKDGQTGIAIGRINRQHLQAYAEVFLPQGARLYITDAHHQHHIFQQQTAMIRHTVSELSEIDLDGEAWLISDWELFLEAAYNTPPWHIIIAEPKQLLFSAWQDLQVNTGLTAFATFWIILLAGSILIRQILHPLDQLKQATDEISRGNFDLDLSISGHDEFGDLSKSLSSLADKINRQINYQKNLGQAVRCIFGSDNEERIIKSFFLGLGHTLNTTAAGLLIYDENNKQHQHTNWVMRLDAPGDLYSIPVVGFHSQQYPQFIHSEELFTYAVNGEFPSLHSPFNHLGAHHFLHFHVAVGKGRGAILTLADGRHIPGEEELNGTRQLLDQFGIALSRSDTLQELANLNMGVLTALARTVDANSPWTRGHSERVTQYAIDIARALGYSTEECVDLQHASLLHDLGKISIPSEILNKPGKLTAEEMNLMRGHPVEGDRILEPIAAFTGIRPIVKQHHERWDGTGYPDGLSHEEICSGARILAVADVYDALYSDRPYRQGWPQPKVISYLRKESGRAFDPRIVEAFMQVLKQEAA